MIDLDIGKRTIIEKIDSGAELSPKEVIYLYEKFGIDELQEIEFNGNSDLLEQSQLIDFQIVEFTDSIHPDSNPNYSLAQKHINDAFSNSDKVIIEILFSQDIIFEQVLNHMIYCISRSSENHMLAFGFRIDEQISFLDEELFMHFFKMINSVRFFKPKNLLLGVWNPAYSQLFAYQKQLKLNGLITHNPLSLHELTFQD